MNCIPYCHLPLFIYLVANVRLSVRFSSLKSVLVHYLLWVRASYCLYFFEFLRCERSNVVCESLIRKTTWIECVCYVKPFGCYLAWKCSYCRSPAVVSYAWSPVQSDLIGIRDISCSSHCWRAASVHVPGVWTSKPISFVSNHFIVWFRRERTRFLLSLICELWPNSQNALRIMRRIKVIYQRKKRTRFLQDKNARTCDFCGQEYHFRSISRHRFTDHGIPYPRQIRMTQAAMDARRARECDVLRLDVEYC